MWTGEPLEAAKATPAVTQEGCLGAIQDDVPPTAEVLACSGVQDQTGTSHVAAQQEDSRAS